MDVSLTKEPRAVAAPGFAGIAGDKANGRTALTGPPTAAFPVCTR